MPSVLFINMREKLARYPAEPLSLAALLASVILLRFAVQPIVVAVLRHEASLTSALQQHLWTLCAAGALLAASLFVAVRDLVRGSWSLAKARQSELVAFALVAFALAWPAPMMLGGGSLLYDDWGPQLRALVAACDAVSAHRMPGFTFEYGNGVSYVLYYPPLSTYLGTLFVLVFRSSPEFALKLVAFTAQCLFVLGGFRLLRRFRFDGFSSACAVLAVSLSQQYFAAGFMNGALASCLALGLLPWIVLALRAAWTGAVKPALWLGALLGLSVMAQPVAAFFAGLMVAVLSTVVLVLGRVRPAKMMRIAILTAFSALVLAAPYLASLAFFSPYNAYRAGSVSHFAFPPIEYLRSLIWNPRTGSPPGIGTDKSGYIGVVAWFCTGFSALAACAALLRRSRKRFPLTECLFLTTLLGSCFLVYGSRWKVYSFVPFVYLAKGTYRLFPLLAIALLFGLALFFRRFSGRTVLVTGLAAAAFLEQAPFSVRPYFTSRSNAVSVLPDRLKASSAEVMLVGGAAAENTAILHALYDWETRNRIRDIYYIHHEEISAVADAYWRIRTSLQDPASSLEDARSNTEELRFLAVTDILSPTPLPASYRMQFGDGDRLMVGGHPVWIYPVLPAPQWRSVRSVDSATFSPTAEQRGAVILPVGYQPSIQAHVAGTKLATASSRGFLSVCCVAGQPAIQLSFAFPRYLIFLDCASVLSLLLLSAASFDFRLAGFRKRAVRAAFQKNGGASLEVLSPATLSKD